MWQRYEGYLKGRESLLAMAYFCLTVVESSVGLGSQRKRAAERYRIETRVLAKLGELTVAGDDRTARKRNPQNRPLSDLEEVWVQEAVRALIFQLGRYAANPPTLREFTMSDLPSLTEGQMND
jgi:hypothetical protein